MKEEKEISNIPTCLRKPARALAGREYSMSNIQIPESGYSLLGIGCWILFFIVFHINVAFPQNKKIDSLLSAINTAKEACPEPCLWDTNKVNALNALVNQFISSEPQKSLAYAQQALKLAQQTKWKKGIGNSEHSIGYYYYTQGDYPNTLEHWLNALKIWEELNDKKGISVSLGNIGIVYKQKGDYPKALAHYLKALKMAEDLGDKNGIARHLGNIGSVYEEQGAASTEASAKVELFNKALDYYFKALKIAEDLGNKNTIAINLGNIGGVYDEQASAASPDSAVYRERLFNLALDYYFKALKMKEELGNKNGIAINLGNIGALYFKEKKFADAGKYLNDALSLSKEIGDMEGMKENYQNLSVLNSTLGNYKSAFEHYKLYIIYRDSIANEENTKKQTQTEMQYEFDKKQTADSITNAEKVNQEELKHGQEIQQQKIYTYGGAIGFLLMIVVAGVSFRAFKQKQKLNLIISEQKKLVEEKQKDILDSIYYARRIQQSLLPTEKYIAKNLKRLMTN